MTIMQTYTGGRFDLLKPSMRDVNLLDIAHHLSMICRYHGATKWHYSVAQHSFVVATLLQNSGSKYVMEGLMHDAAEAYYNDASRPLKLAMRDYAGASHTAYDHLIKRGERVIAEKFGLTYPWPEEVRAADLMALAIERRDLLIPTADVDWRPYNLPDPLEMGVSNMTPEVAKHAFLGMYQSLIYAKPEKIDGPVAVVQ